MKKIYNSYLRKLLKLDGWKRRLYFVGILTKALQKHNITPIVVGGHAVEFYTLGGYTTGDIDLIVSDRKKLDEILSTFGFRKVSRMWINEDLELFVEAPGSTLTDEEKEHITTTMIEDMKVYFIGIEDLIIDRLNAFVWWKSLDDGYWAEELIRLFIDKIDQKYLLSRAKEEKTESELKRILRKAKRKCKK